MLPVWISCALLIGSEYVLSEMVVHCFLIAQSAPVLEREPRFVPRVWPYGWNMLKSGLRWNVTWWRGAAFDCRKPVDRWVHAGGIDCFPIATFDHADSSGFKVRISPRTNLGDWVVIDGIPIGSHVKPSIRFIIAGCLTVTWNVVVEFLSPRWNSKPMVIVRRSYYSWVGR
jgi:hypothetical protein